VVVSMCWFTAGPRGLVQSSLSEQDRNILDELNHVHVQCAGGPDTPVGQRANMCTACSNTAGSSVHAGTMARRVAFGTVVSTSPRVSSR
jgi:hypothetical protein